MAEEEVKKDSESGDEEVAKTDESKDEESDDKKE